MNDTPPLDNYWTNKLKAFLHDPPDKVFDIEDHRNRSIRLERGVIQDENALFEHICDHTAAAADRLPWPKPGIMLCPFSLEGSVFKHPLGGGSNHDASPDIPFSCLSDSAVDLANISEEALQRSRPVPGEDSPQLRFFAMWRFWRYWAAQQNGKLALLPADTRLPDHTIWNHNGIVSAMQGCVEGSGINAKLKPAFLILQIGGVQDFISQARSTRDLWSGSYLLSYLMATGLAYIARTYGPDHVIFPSLNGQPLMDLALKRDIYDKMSMAVEEQRNADTATCWDLLGYAIPENGRNAWSNLSSGAMALVTPTLPNRFMAVLPASKAENCAKTVANAIKEKLQIIGDKVWTLSKELFGDIDGSIPGDIDPERLEERFKGQVARMLDISWQVLPWPESVVEAKHWIREKPAFDGDTASALENIVELAKTIPIDQRDIRNYDLPIHEVVENGATRLKKNANEMTEDTPLANVGCAWAGLTALANWQFDGARQARTFEAWNDKDSGWQKGAENNKDSLNGKEEVVFSVIESTITDLGSALNKKVLPEHLFSSGEILGASTLIKRLWHKAYLMPEYNADGNNVFCDAQFSFPDTRAVASGNALRQRREGTVEGNASEKENYIAIIALDGDEMGKWVSGANLPKLKDQLSGDSGEPVENVRFNNPKGYFTSLDNRVINDILEQPRPLSPSIQLQFSEMLGNFSLYCARRIVEAHQGVLIYSGGDDVLAMLPADKALECARYLRAAFRGDSNMLNTLTQGGEQIFACPHDGVLKLHDTNIGAPGNDMEPASYPALLPGPATDVSCGIAIGHYMFPLQHLVKEAQSAEKRAKNELKRGAFAITVFKRSGETVLWGAKWDSPNQELFTNLFGWMANKQLENRFPYKAIEFIQGLAPQTKGSQADEQTLSELPHIVAELVAHAASQTGISRPENLKIIKDLIGKICISDGEVTADQRVSQLVSLLQTLGWMSRNTNSNTNEQ